MQISENYINNEQLRRYASAFSRNVFCDIANFSDFSHLDWLHSCYNEPLKQNASYMDYLSYMYSRITKSYRCEYVFKNEVINQLLLKQFGTKSTIAFNEFKVGDSIVDLAMMNGESKAFEIKTMLDGPKRLFKQMFDYRKVFNKCYIVVESDECDYYSRCVDDDIGIILLSYNRGSISLSEFRPARKNDLIDPDCLIKCLRETEYVNIIKEYFNKLPSVPCYELFDACREQMKHIPQEELNRLFLSEIKKRRSVTSKLKSFPKEIRQLLLSLNLPQKKQESLMSNLSKPINSVGLCTTRI